METTGTVLLQIGEGRVALHTHRERDAHIAVSSGCVDMSVLFLMACDHRLFSQQPVLAVCVLAVRRRLTMSRAERPMMIPTGKIISDSRLYLLTRRPTTDHPTAAPATPIRGNAMFRSCEKRLV